MGYFPVMVDMEGKSVAIVGSTSAAQQKTRQLVAVGAQVTVFGCGLEPALPRSTGLSVRVYDRLPQPEDLMTCVLVIAAHADGTVNQAVRLMADRVRVLVNVVDDREASNCIMVSQLRRGDLVVGVSTSGIAPGLARRIRLELEPLFGSDWAQWLTRFGVLRKEILAHPDPMTRRQLLTREEERVMARWTPCQRK
ncbi:MAG: hypothetical protein C7B45_06445 [Sulfobacillus acidophilus]|uniref:precorrin-2 dehydrogenase n=1 Tax=Sulfobacillus acidophilus TaxID=53633 RepID=A0A2T2WJY7_9FIRM|nr:MAG: hypothetical protein C7B45_06445 [Sulfobacillus acidophilus]